MTAVEFVTGELEVPSPPSAPGAPSHPLNLSNLFNLSDAAPPNAPYDPAPYDPDALLTREAAEQTIFYLVIITWMFCMTVFAVNEERVYSSLRALRRRAEFA